MRDRISSRISSSSSEAREHRVEPVLREVTYVATINVYLARPASRVRSRMTSLIPRKVTNRLYVTGYCEQGRAWEGMDVVSIGAIAFITVFSRADKNAKASGGCAKQSGDRAKASGGCAKASGRLAKASGERAKPSGTRAKGSGSRAKGSGERAKASGSRARAAGD